MFFYNIQCKGIIMFSNESLKWLSLLVYIWIIVSTYLTFGSDNCDLLQSLSSLSDLIPSQILFLNYHFFTENGKKISTSIHK